MITWQRDGGLRFHTQRVVSLVALLGLSACGGGDGGIVVPRVTCSITGVVVQPAATTLSVGESTPLQAQPSSQNCTSVPAATWSSATPSVATVGATTGQVTAVTPGTAVITASVGSASGTSVVTVRVPPVASIFVAPQTPSPLQVGQTVTLTAEPRDAQGRALTGRTVTWQSAATNIATVNASGLVTAVAPGSTTITASSEGINQPVPITVTTRPPASIDLSPGDTTFLASTSKQATAVVRDAQGAVLANETVTWLSTNTAVATVSASGLITAIAQGQATVRVTSTANSAVSKQSVITVNTGGPASVAVTLVATLNITQTATATAVVRDAAQNILPGANVQWTSSNPAVASVVSTTGAVNALTPGTTNIIASVVGLPAISGSRTLTVGAPVATVSLAQSNVLLEPGPPPGLVTQQLDVTLRDAAQNILTGRTITYTSSNTAAATVNTSGLVTAVAVGTGTITVTSEGVSATIPLIVARAFAVVDAIQPTNTSTYQPPQFNSAGSPITVTRAFTGQYRVVFAGLGTPAGPFTGTTTIGRSFTFLVNATNSSINSQLPAPSAMCNGSSFDQSGPTVLTVLCVDPVTLMAKDAPFRAMIIGDNSVGSTGVGAAFSIHRVTSTALYTPPSVWAWNSTGGAMTVTPGFGAPDFGGTQVRHSTGFVFAPQYGLVSTLSNTAGVACELQNQPPSSLFTDVVCFNRAGPVNESHMLLKLSSGRPGQNGGLAFLDAATGVLSGGFSSATGAVITSRTGAGKYTVVFGGMVASGAIGVMVTPWGASGWAACSHYVVSTNPVTIDVACFNSVGAFANAGAALTVLVLQ